MGQDLLLSLSGPLLGHSPRWGFLSFQRSAVWKRGPEGLDASVVLPSAEGLWGQGAEQEQELVPLCPFRNWFYHF